MKGLFSHAHGIYALDSNYIRPMMAAIHLIVEQNEVAFVDTGVNASLPRVLAALDHLQLRVADVKYVLLTHVHLDHAGGAGAMMQSFPNAMLVVHPRGARHMVDPGKLVEGATAVYGAEQTRNMYGEIVPVDASRVISAEHGHSLNLAGRQIDCLDTPGHARHHLCFRDHRSQAIFSGDIFGISLRELDVTTPDGRVRELTYPATTPTQFDPEAMHHSVQMLMDLRPPYVYCTHFGETHDVSAKGESLHRLVRQYIEIALRHRDAGSRRQELVEIDLRKLLIDEARAMGSHLSDEDFNHLIDKDMHLNAQGLVYWLDQGAPGMPGA